MPFWSSEEDRKTARGIVFPTNTADTTLADTQARRLHFIGYHPAPFSGCRKPDTQARRNLTPCQATVERNANRIPFELVTVYCRHIQSPFDRASPSEDQNETGAGPPVRE